MRSEKEQNKRLKLFKKKNAFGIQGNSIKSVNLNEFNGHNLSGSKLRRATINDYVTFLGSLPDNIKTIDNIRLCNYEWRGGVITNEDITIRPLYGANNWMNEIILAPDINGNIPQAIGNPGHTNIYKHGESPKFGIVVYPDTMPRDQKFMDIVLQLASREREEARRKMEFLMSISSEHSARQEIFNKTGSYLSHIEQVELGGKDIKEVYNYVRNDLDLFDDPIERDTFYSIEGFIKITEAWGNYFGDGSDKLWDIKFPERSFKESNPEYFDFNSSNPDYPEYTLYHSDGVVEKIRNKNTYEILRKDDSSKNTTVVSQSNDDVSDLYF